MKKVILVGIMFMMFMGVVSASSINGEYKGNPKVFVGVNGKTIISDVPAIIYDGSTLIPLRAVVEAMGGTVNWDASTNSASITTQQTDSVNNVKTTTPDADRLMERFGSAGTNSIKLVRYTSLGGGTGILEFDLSFATTDTSKNNAYNDLINAAVDSNVYQVMFKYSDGFDSVINTADTKDFWSKKITLNEYLSKIHIINENISLTPSSNTLSTDSTIESTIDGTFEGWTGETIFKLSNGQIWQQSIYAYYYYYAFSPKVTIYSTSSGYKMKVDGVDDAINVKRIK